jgi:hypothetical protein
MSQSVGFGFAAFAMLFELAIYCAIAFVIWKFYQMISRIADDITAIKAILKRDSSAVDHDVDLDLSIPPDHPLA